MSGPEKRSDVRPIAGRPGDGLIRVIELPEKRYAASASGPEPPLVGVKPRPKKVLPERSGASPLTGRKKFCGKLVSVFRLPAGEICRMRPLKFAPPNWSTSRILFKGSTVRNSSFEPKKSPG